MFSWCEYNGHLFKTLAKRPLLEERYEALKMKQYMN